MKKKTSKLFKFDKYLLILRVISVLFLASVVRYSLRTYQFPQWDEQHYMQMAAGYFRLFQNLSFSTPYEMLQLVPVRQPGYPLLILPFLLIFGLSNAYFWGLFTNGLLYIATTFGVYFIARNYLSALSSFMAAIIFAFYGWTLLHVHYTYTETATSALCVWTIYFLIKSNFFQNRKFSILFGVFFGLSLLTRWVALVFIAGPALYVFYEFIKRGLFQKRAFVLNGAIAVLSTFLVAAYPYIVNNFWYTTYFAGHRVGGAMWQLLPEHEKAQFSLFTLTFYLNTFNQLGTYFFVLIIAGIILSLREAKRREARHQMVLGSNLNLILAAVFVPWIFFSFFSILKADRFIIPIFPYLAIISASVFDYIKNTRIKFALVCLTIILSIGTFLGTDWGKGPMRQSLQSISLPFSIGEIKKIYLSSISRPPYIYKISGKEIVDYLARDSRENRIENPQVLSLFYYRPLDEPMMTHNLYHQERPLNIINFLGTVVTDPKDTGHLNTALASDYVLIKTGQKVDKSFSEVNVKLLKALIKLFENDVDLEKYYEQKVKFWIYQDSSEVMVYKKKAQTPPEEIERLKLMLSEYLTQ